MTTERQLVLTEVRAAAQQIHDVVRAATADQLAADSPLPDWTRAHVAAHIAGFSDAMARQWEYALRGEQIEQYSGGAEGRNADIHELAGRPVEELKAGTERAMDHLASAADAMGEQDWVRPISYRQGNAFGGLEAAWREYAIHLVDLDLGPQVSAWTEPFCEHLLDFLGPRIPDGMTLVLPSGRRIGRGPAEVGATGSTQDIAAWLAGRVPDVPVEFSTGEAPELDGWPARKN